MDVAPADDSVDSNAVIIEGSGDIYSLGNGPGGFINKRVVFRPVGEASRADAIKAPAEIILHHNPPELVLTTNNDRRISEECYGVYVCNDQGHWFELYFTATGVAAIENRLAELERRLLDLERRPAKRPRKKQEE